MTLYKLGFVVDKYSYKFELADNYRWTSSTLNLSKLYETVYGIVEKSTSDLM
jgi:hypothetical protein